MVNIPDDNGLTPILWAAFNGQLVSLNLLHTHGADPHYKGPSGENALSMASANGHTHVVKALLGLGVNVNATDEVCSIFKLKISYSPINLVSKGWKHSLDVCRI